MPSFIQTKISKIKNLKLGIVEQKDTSLLDYKLGVEVNSRQIIYINAKVTSNSLDKGKEKQIYPISLRFFQALTYYKRHLDRLYNWVFSREIMANNLFQPV
jgi:hypothetical protein